MRFMTAKEIRETWLRFFNERGHSIEQSASLIPQNDPTLLWINAGVAPLKKYFDGSETPKSPRITNVQKCIRTNDIDNVGRTARHHTFFEMMGNFSIGNYFKVEAIEFGFELLTGKDYFDIPLDKLYMTYYPDDSLTKETWLRLGVKENHLIPNENNFWEIGDGPSGPDTEIFFDRGESYDKRGVELIEHDIENERYIEIWNIVFSQYNAKSGVDRKDYQELPNKNIDTGAGLERFACVLQGTKTNFETDLFLPIIQKIEKMSGVKYEGQMAFKVIADHIRTLVMTISDGALLSNEGRGYVLRRILRRAVKYGLVLGFEKPFLYQLIDTVIDIMKPFYKQIEQTRNIVEKVIYKEEEKFFETIREGEKHLLNSIVDHRIDGEVAFKLYDTYGFPIELTLEYAEEHNVTVDVDGFNEALKEQKMRSRLARKETASMKSQEEAFLNFIEKSEFIGYNELTSESTIIAVFDDAIVLDKTPFYATSGGQVKDQGTIAGYQVLDVTKMPHGQFLHKLESHDLNVGDVVLAIVDEDSREKTMINHSATHLLHQALKDVLGNHSHQQGSEVSAHNMRFDFNHFDAITDNELLRIEGIVNEHIEKAHNVDITYMPIDEAKKLGAQALFGEKYGDIVRVVNMGNYSIELCGGTHVKNTKDIKKYAITSFESIGSGIFRIEGVGGQNIEEAMRDYMKNLYNDVETLIDKVKRIESKDVPFNFIETPRLIGSYQDIINLRNYLETLKQNVKAYEKDLNERLSRDFLKNIDTYIPKNPSKKIILELPDVEQNILKQAIDVIYDKIKAEVVFIISKSTEKATYLCKTDGNTNASELVKLLASKTKGSGGGKPTLAQGGTKELVLISEGVKALKEVL